MKTLNNIKLAFIAILSSILSVVAVQPAEAMTRGGVSFQLFYDELAPYGEWVNDYEYGYIWLPDVGPNFMPYRTNGHWVMTQYGNTWVSNYDWGWAPFHYGRWIHSDYYGWAWIPDYEWGPAWVSWRNGNGHYGWAPLGPRMNIHVRVNIPTHHWVFVPHRHIFSVSLNRYYVPRRNHVRIYNRTTIINNTYVYNNHTYISGPSRAELQRVTGNRVAVRQINNQNSPTRSSVNSRSVNMYRPAIDQSTRTAARPSRVTDAETVRTRSAANGSAVQPRATTGRSNNAAVQPRATTGRSNNTAVQPRATTGRSNNTAVQPRANTGRSNNTAVQPRATTGRSTNNTAVQPRTTTQRQSSSSAQSRTATSRASERAVQPTRAETRAAQPAARATQRAAQPAARTQTQRSNNSRTQTRATTSSRSQSQNSRATNGTTRGQRN